MPIIKSVPNEPEELLDARQWERSDEHTLYEACLALVNAGIKNNGIANLTNNGREVDVVSWTPGSKEWRAAIRKVKRYAKDAKKSRKHRKMVQQELLNTSMSDANKEG
jgi:hypothetical protein